MAPCLWTGTIGIVLVLLLSAAPARAQRCGFPERIEACDPEGEEAMRGGQFEKALDLFWGMYRVTEGEKRVCLLWIARCHADTGDIKNWRSYVDRYLQEEPASPYKPQLQCWQVLPNILSPPPTRHYNRGLFWGVVGGVVAVAIVGITLGVTLRRDVPQGADLGDFMVRLPPSGRSQ